MQTFTPYSALIGGTLIGLGATILLWLNGQIAGISGIVNDLLRKEKEPTQWRWWFVIGLIIGAGMYVWTSLPIEPQTTSSYSQLVLAGVLVGFGARMGNGCTSGHGVCGLARLSPRSVIATAVFLTTAALTVFVSRHMGGV